MTVQFIDSTSDGVNTGTQLSIALPALGAAGDFLVAVIVSNHDNTFNMNPPASFNGIGRVKHSAVDLTIFSYYRTYSGSAGPFTWDWTGNRNAAGIIAAFRNVDTSGFEVDQVSEGNSTSIQFPSVTTIGENRLIVRSIGARTGPIAPNTTYPPNYQLLAQRKTTNDIVVAIYMGIQHAVGATGSVIANVDVTGNYLARSIAFAPAPLSSGTTKSRKPPDSILAQSNLTGLVGNIQDDPDAPDTNWLTA